MSKDEAELVNAGPVAPPDHRAMHVHEREMVLQLINMLGTALGPWRTHMMELGAAPNSDTLLAAAAATYSGTIMGELIGMGVLPENSLPKVLRTMRSNILDGVNAGKRKVVRIAEQVLAEDQQGGVQ